MAARRLQLAERLHVPHARAGRGRCGIAFGTVVAQRAQHVPLTAASVQNSTRAAVFVHRRRLTPTRTAIVLADARLYD
jgi:hypothetical protein